MKQPAAHPKVSVICLCYNHEKFVQATLASVWQQTHQDMEVIVVDDGSKDESVKVIRQFLDDNPAPFPVKTFFLEQNVGNCLAFNQGWQLAKGKYIVDLATDDVMLPERLEKQVAYFEALPEDYGVVFTESQYIDEDGNPLHFHFADQYRHIRPIPTGDVYQEVLSRYFISSPTMIYRQEVLQRLNGYDEQLAYEDFDFWVRSARDYKYAYLDECTTLVRKSARSMSRQLYKSGDRQLYSTLLVCRKAAVLNQTSAENQALAKRLLYEAKHALFSANFKEAAMFLDLYQQRKLFSFTYIFLKFILVSRINFSVIYRWHTRHWQGCRNKRGNL